MAEHDYRLLSWRGYVQLLYALFFTDWERFPKDAEGHNQARLVVQGLVLVMGSVLAGAALHYLTTEGFESQQFAEALAFSIAFGLIFGVTEGVATGVAAGVTAGVIYGVAAAVTTTVVAGVTASVAFGVAFGLANGVANGVAFSVAFGVANGVTFGVAFGIFYWAFIGASDWLVQPWGNVIGLGLGFVVLAIGVIVALVVGLVFGFIATAWNPRRASTAWLGAITLLLGLGALGSLGVSAATSSLTGQTLSPIVVASIIIVMATRLPLWPLEALWSVWCSWWLKLRATDMSPEWIASAIERAYFDRLMIMPLPKEALWLERLAARSPEHGHSLSVLLASEAHHELQTTATLCRLATRAPLSIQAWLADVVRYGVKHERLNRYVLFGLPEAPARVWNAMGDLQALARELVSIPSTLSQPGMLMRHFRTLLDARSEISNEQQVGVAELHVTLEQSIGALLATHQSQPDIQHLDAQVALLSGLQTALQANTIGALATYQAPVLPSQESALYPTALCEELQRLDAVAQAARGYVTATSPVTRSHRLLDAQAALGRAEVDAIETAARFSYWGVLIGLVLVHWQKLLNEESDALVHDQQNAASPQPYVIANPVVGTSFVGREDILRRLESLWSTPGQRTSVVLYGHRRMGKSSILQNLRGEQFGERTRIVDFNLQTYGLVPDTAALLHNLALELHDASRDITSLAQPSPSAYSREPYGTFVRYLKKIDKKRAGYRFIVTLDEFEILEERIKNGRLEPDLISYLRGIITSQTWLTLAFAGLHTLREMTKDYWNPLYSSVEAIPVSFLSEGATRRLLTEPAPDFDIDYDQDALSAIYALTHGQPYLTQLIGHHLVTRLNAEIFERQVARERRFRLDDVEAVVTNDAFFGAGDAYFQGIWAQARREPIGQQAILHVLANGPLTNDDIVHTTGLDGETIHTAIERLTQHDIIACAADGRWSCTVELMRRWLRRLPPPLNEQRSGSTPEPTSSDNAVSDRAVLAAVQVPMTNG